MFITRRRESSECRRLTLWRNCRPKELNYTRSLDLFPVGWGRRSKRPTDSTVIVPVIRSRAVSRPSLLWMTKKESLRFLPSFFPFYRRTDVTFGGNVPSPTRRDVTAKSHSGFRTNEASKKMKKKKIFALLQRKVDVRRIKVISSSSLCLFPFLRRSTNSVMSLWRVWTKVAIKTYERWRRKKFFLTELAFYSIRIGQFRRKLHLWDGFFSPNRSHLAVGRATEEGRWQSVTEIHSMTNAKR